MIVPGGSGAAGDFAYALSAVLRAAWRYRSELAPAYWLAGVMVVGAWLHKVHPSWWPLPAVAGVGAVGLVWWLPRWLVTRWPLLARWQVRVWSACFTTAVSGWSTTATLIGSTAGAMESYAVAAALGLGVPWWWREDRRRLTRVRIIRERFPDTAHAVGLEGAQMVSAVLSRWGWTARLKLRRGQYFADAVTALPRLESALGSGIGTLRVEAVPSDAAQVVLRMVETDPHADPIAFVARPGKRPASINDPVTVGVWEDGSDVAVSLLRRHVLIGGATDSGKSGLLNVILARLAECRDVTVWGVDLKEGMELAPWAKVLHRLAVNTGTAERLLTDGVAELERRAAFLTDHGKRVWEPALDAPALVVTIDEYAELSPRARKLADSIARRGRAVAVTLVVATQRPTQKTMGDGTAIRSQMNVRFCLRVTERPDVDLILGSGAQTGGWDTTGFDAPGKFLLSAPEHTAPRRARGYLITDPEVTATANRHARPDTQGEPPDHRPHDRPQKRPQDRPQDGPPAPAGSTPTHGRDSDAGATDGPPRAPGTPGKASAVSGPDVALWEALRHAPPHGASITELITATGRSKAVIYRKLQTLRGQGKAVQISRGRWRATTPGSNTT